MTDVLNRIGTLVAELQAIGCDVAVDAATINITIRYPAPAGGLDEPTARRIVQEVAAEPAAKPAPAPRATETRGRDHSISPITGAKRRGGFSPTVDYAEVAQIARDAFAAGRPMQNAVATHYGIEKPAASMRIRKARGLGHDIPARNSNVGQRQEPPRQEPPRTPLTDIAHLEGLLDGTIDPDDAA